MKPSSDSPGSSRRGKRPMIPPPSSSSSESSSSSSSSERTRYDTAGEENKSTAAPQDCYVCGRQFGASKALFGHMRCHPERQWRGIRPLPEGEESSTRRRKWRRLAREDAPAEEAGTGEYSCGGCSREFSTRQALGGHRASHRGVMGCSAKAKVATAAMALAGVGNGRDQRDFVCHACGRQFATYHGMRIHQRVHRGRRGEVVAQVGREERGFMVDLNLPPPPEREEQEEEDR